MKALIYQIIAVLSASFACAQNLTNTLPPWEATVHVVNEAERPIKDALVKIGFSVAAPPGEDYASETIEGLTDANGIFTASHEDTRSVGLGFSATKDGYYPGSQKHVLFLAGQFEQSKMAENRKPDITMVLKPIRTPIPMYAKRVREGPPVADKAVGYDLQVGDWISPWGKGKSTDIIFRADVSQNKLTVTFPNPGDGIQPFVASDLDKTSAFRSPYQAPETGYESQWTKTRGETADEQARIVQDKSKIYFLRLRTVLDEQGNVKQANYGKIYGDFMDFQYFLNPEVNSRNVEFDPTKNLLKNVGPAEHVRSP